MRNIIFTEDQKTEFYTRMYFESLAKIDKINEKKFALLKLSLIGTFAYYAWLYASLEKLHEKNNTCLEIVVLFLPLGFNIFGFFYNLYFKKIADQYSGFTTYLLSRANGVENIWEAYKGERNSKSYNFSQTFWGLMWILSVVLGMIGLKL